MDPISLPRDTALRWASLARRLGLSVEDLLTGIAENVALMDQIAASLAGVLVKAPAGDRIVSPPDPVCFEPAKIEVSGNAVRAWLPHRDEGFVNVVYPLGYRWGGAAWHQSFAQWQHPVVDRAVELAVLLLNAGFIVQPPSDLVSRVIAGDYTPLPATWVKRRTKGRCTDWFEITWPENGPDFYRKAALIRGAKVYPNVALVPKALYDDVLDFAQTHGFAVSAGALNLAAIAKAERDAMLFACPSTSKAKDNGAAKPAAPSVTPKGILDELADEPL
jgi:hypothetical protein